MKSDVIEIDINNIREEKQRVTLSCLYDEIVWYLTSEGTYALPILLTFFCIIPLIVLLIIYLTWLYEW